MKRVLLALVILTICASICYAQPETTLSTPFVVIEPAVKMKQVQFTIIPAENKVRAEMRFLDASSNVVQIKECEFTDSSVTNAVIQSGKVGQKYINVLMTSIHNKCKTLWGLSGTE